jgi:4-alpha-glucanotransferase
MRGIGECQCTTSSLASLGVVHSNVTGGKQRSNYWPEALTVQTPNNHPLTMTHSDTYIFMRFVIWVFYSQLKTCVVLWDW